MKKTGSLTSENPIRLRSIRGIISLGNDRCTRVKDFHKYSFVRRITGIGSSIGIVVGKDYRVTNRHVAKMQ